MLLFAHVPPGKFERFYQYYSEMEQYGFPWLSETFNTKFVDLMNKYSDVFAIQLFGHHHTDSWKVYRDAEGTAKTFALLAPGVTPWNSTLAPETGANNPGLRLFKYDKNTGEVSFKIFCTFFM